MLCTSTHTPSQTHEFKDSIDNEVSATGYTAGGATLGSKTIGYATRVSTFDAGDVSWTITGTLTARYAVVYKDTGSAATSPLIMLLNFGEDKVATDGTFTITWNASGLFTITPAAEA